MTFYVGVGGYSQITEYKIEASHFLIDQSVQNFFWLIFWIWAFSCVFWSCSNRLGNFLLICGLDYLEKTDSFLFLIHVPIFSHKAFHVKALTYANLTWAGHSSILLVSAVMFSPSIMFAVPESWFIPSTRNVIHPNAPRTCTGISPPSAFDISWTS